VKGLLFALALSATGGGIAGAAKRSESRATQGAQERRAVVFYTGAVHGTLEPCGCTSDPLGDIARMTGLVRRAGKPSEVLVVDAGNLIYPQGDISPRRRESADLQAAFLAKELSKLPFGGSALGELDLARGPEKVVPKRLAANMSGGPSFVEPSRVRQVGGIKIGIFGLADPAAARAHGVKAEDPVAAAAREAARLRDQGAEVIIALAALERAQARLLARAAAVDFIVVGKNVGQGLARADRVDRTFILAPADELQKVGRLEIVLRGGGTTGDGRRTALADAGGPEAQALEREELERTLARLEAELARWAKDRNADPAFVAARRRERDAVKTRLGQLASGKWAPPATGSYFLNRLVPLRRALPRDPVLAAAMRRLDKQVGAANLRRAEPPPKAEPGRAAFVGDKACVGCHKRQMAFYERTVHARAWKTIVDGGKTGHEDCVSCHVTGFGEVGGSSLGYVKGLTNVQCESCHGPGSLHVAAEGLEEPPAVQLATPESTCVQCHNEKHSDTFDYVAYMRDVLGPGHGAEARKKLGPGPTGRELRSAAIKKAKAAGEALVKSM
jgi:hypothetical protein